MNQLVAFNLARARRQKGWTQEETAARLTAATGKRWTSATLGAAERSSETGRTREFDANELMAFCRVFAQPLAYFFLPSRPNGAWLYSLGAHADGEAETIETLDLLIMAMAMKPSAEFRDAIAPVLAHRGLTWRVGYFSATDAEREGQVIVSATSSEATLETIAMQLRSMLRLIEQPLAGGTS
ncbi:hypothetical protein F8568_036810 [Actinomadura sp. LD22]|uniref:Uncharacterized protein n=1 Tax=Actinomadura physcomitrii TaxID=2650748 RepID=A0A6I4MNX3_9ACTN|nr:hypothetical protein [Actinomadura physcomitrii]MWA05824.1 hypothetical protein [Actinomadura physcomitrii]